MQVKQMSKFEFIVWVCMKRSTEKQWNSVIAWNVQDDPRIEHCEIYQLLGYVEFWWGQFYTALYDLKSAKMTIKQTLTSAVFFCFSCHSFWAFCRCCQYLICKIFKHPQAMLQNRICLSVRSALGVFALHWNLKITLIKKYRDELYGRCVTI